MNDKIHRPQMAGVVACLSRIFNEREYADKCLERQFKAHRQWGARDRRAVAEATYEIVRWWRRLLWLCGKDGSEQKITDAQLWQLLGTWLVLEGKSLPPWPEFTAVSDSLHLRQKGSPPSPAIMHSVPDWLYEMGLQSMGEELWAKSLKALNSPATVYLRTNTLRTSRKELCVNLSAQGIGCEEVVGSDVAVALCERKNIFVTPEFKKGWFELQDLASQRVGKLVNPQPGMRVIDACAGAGGKTLHMAALMQNRGKILALDIHDWKLNELRQRVRRNGVDIVECRLIKDRKVIKRLHGSADKLLLDVPCSGLGVLRRNPDAKWKLTPERVAELVNLQQELLRDYSKMVKAGGHMVYATCSILQQENQKQVQSFLHAHPQWRLESEELIKPQDFNSDGFYMALLFKV